MIRFLFISTLLLLSNLSIKAQTVGLLEHLEGADAGYTMISRGGTAYLLDTAGQVLHTWEHGLNSRHPGYLQENGDWVTVSRGVKWYSWSGDLIWEYNNPKAHHDIAVMPNGHVLVLIWGDKTQAEAVAAGRDPALISNELWPMVIYEVNQLGEVVWQWHVWDHLIQDFDDQVANYGVVADHPELMDINFIRNTGSDWLHANAIDYHPVLDQILISPRYINELWIIDHSTTTEEAASHSGGNNGKGGDILYRWGNPSVYRGSGPQMNFGGHDAQWIKPGLAGAGNILFFNNGGEDYGRDGNYSSIDEFTPPLNGFNYTMLPQGIFGPLALQWSFQADPPEAFFSSFISGVQRLPNGHTFVDDGDEGFLFEVSNDDELVWQYQNPIQNSGILFQGDAVPFAPATSLFRASKYPSDHPAFAGRNSVPLGTVEQYNTFNTLSIVSSDPERITYPTQDNLTLGAGQKIPLITVKNDQYKLSNWSVTSGSAFIEDEFSDHTTLIMGNENTTIAANFELNPDWIFGTGFE